MKAHHGICRILFATAVALLIIGCDNCGEKVGGEDAIVCGKIRFSRRTAEDLVEAKVLLTSALMPKSSAKQLAEMRTFISSNVVVKLKQDFVVSNYLKEANMAVEDAAIDKQLQKIFRSKKAMMAFLDGQSAANKAYIRSLVRADLAFEMVRTQVVDKANVSIPAEKVRDVVSRITAYNRVALATNALVYAQASNCWQEIKSGKLTFAAASLKYDKTPDRSADRHYWGEFPLRALAEDVRLCSLLPNMKPGDVTPPVEADNGLAVVQLIDVTQNEMAGQNLSPEAYYRLNKIFFELPIVYDTPTDDNVRAELLKKEQAHAFAEFMRNQYRRFGF